ncbi:MAG: bioH [Alphaproteobacteria bacterium]|nr:bioH [Alphaproteobacteria bacterium]
MTTDLTLLFVHGWGFDASFWRPLRQALGYQPSIAADLGDFGAPHWPKVPGPVIAIGHSLGALLLLREPPLDCRALIAINGFDHFTQCDDAPGVAPRIVDRMLDKFDMEPRKVLSEFHQRCGEDGPLGRPDRRRLREHLALLRDADERSRSAAWQPPIFSLQGGCDPILPVAAHDQLFARAGHVTRFVHPSGGHALPLSDPSWCVDRIIHLVGDFE